MTCEHNWMRMQWAEEEFKCTECGETLPETQDNIELMNLIDFKERYKKSLTRQD